MEGEGRGDPGNQLSVERENGEPEGGRGYRVCQAEFWTDSFPLIHLGHPAHSA